MPLDERARAALKLQQNTVLALCSVLEAARNPDRSVSSAEIAERYSASAHHLAKVLRRLVQARMLEASRGVGGGYRFSGNAKRLTLMDIIALFEEVSMNPVAAASPHQTAPPVWKIIGRVLSEIDDTAKAAFSSITVSALLKLLEQDRS